MKKYFGLILCCLFLLTACQSEKSIGKQAKRSESSAPSSAENREHDASGDSEDADAAEQEGLTDSAVGVNSMHVNDENLSEAQKMLIGYTDDNYFQLHQYELLQRYPDAYNDAQVVFTGKVTKVIQADDSSYEILATLDEFHDDTFFSQNEVCIKGNQWCVFLPACV